MNIGIAGAGQVAVTRNQGATLRGMGAAALRAAIDDSGRDDIEAVYVGNMLSGMLSRQQHLGALIATEAGLDGVEASTAESACGSGGSALRWGVMAVASGLYRTVAVVGVELMTHADRDLATEALATASDWETEGGRGETFVSLNARLMRLYMERYGVRHIDFAPFALTAHANALLNPNAVFHKALTVDDYENAREIVAPVRLYDASPMCDGAAAIILTSDESPHVDGRPGVRLIATAAASERLGVDVRDDALELRGAARSSARAFEMAGISRAEIDFFEVHDAYTSMAALSLEAAGFVPRGTATHHARDGKFSRQGDLPIATCGGLKGRGHPVGATGVYQAVEAYVQIAGRAGANQLERATTGMIQNIGGTGATVLTHILRRV
jgi:acetyl-CoA C-acetyltransferase